MAAFVLAIGDELVLGQTVDRNSAFLSASLAEHGIGTIGHRTVADDRAAIAAAITAACRQATVVLITGGLGPTADDLTRPALADAMGAPLVEDEASLRSIEQFFKRLGRPMPRCNQTQAMLPAGSEAIVNPRGTAPGIKARINQTTVYALPGVPGEMRGMFEDSILAQLIAAPGRRGVILTAKINTFGRGESSVAEQLAPLMDRQANPRVGTTVADGIVSVRIRSEFADSDQAQAHLEQTIRNVEQRLGPIVFGRDDQTLAEAVFALLGERRLTVATAESCTGGLIGAMLTDVPGSSGVYRGGWITYTNEMKVSQLGVNPDTLAAHGAVSEPVVRAMAAGALARAGADLALSVSGVAGPGGAGAGKPVGLVYLGLALIDGGQGRTVVMRVNLPGHRRTVRDRASRCALQMLRLHLLGKPLELIRWGRVLPDAATPAGPASPGEASDTRM